MECALVTRGQSVFCYRSQTTWQVPSLNITALHQQVCLVQRQRRENDPLWYLYNALSVKRHFPMSSPGRGCCNNPAKPERLDDPENQTLKREVATRAQAGKPHLKPQGPEALPGGTREAPGTCPDLGQLEATSLANHVTSLPQFPHLQSRNNTIYRQQSQPFTCPTPCSLLLCSPFPNRPLAGTSLRPRGWGPLKIQLS